MWLVYATITLILMYQAVVTQAQASVSSVCTTLKVSAANIVWLGTMVMPPNRAVFVSIYF